MYLSAQQQRRTVHGPKLAANIARALAWLEGKAGGGEQPGQHFDQQVGDTGLAPESLAPVTSVLGPVPWIVREIRGWEFCAWKPDAMKAWPGLLPWPGLLQGHATRRGRERQRQRVGAQPQALSKPRPTRRPSGRPPSFTAEKVGKLQREQSRYEKAHPGEPKKDVEQHLLDWAKDTLGIPASINTIRKYMKTTNTKN